MKRVILMVVLGVLFVFAKTGAAQPVKPVLTDLNFLGTGANGIANLEEFITVELKFNADMDTTVNPTVRAGLQEPFTLNVPVGQGWNTLRVWQGFFVVSNNIPATADGEYIFQVFGAKDLSLGTPMDTTLSTDPPLNKTLFICRGGELQLSGNSLDFGTIALGSQQTMSVTINNTSCDAFTVTNISIPFPFSLSNIAAPFTVPANGSRVLTVRFNPTTRDSFSTTMTIFSNDRFQSVPTVNLIGSARGPRISVLTSQLNFGKVELGSSVTLSRTITNLKANESGLSDTLHVANIFSSNPVFTISPRVFALAPDSSKTIDVTFTPTARVNYNAILTISSDDGLNPIRTFSLFGDASDDSPPPPITGLTPDFTLGRLINSGSLGLCWDPSNDPSGLGAIWYYFSTSAIAPLSEPDTSKTSTSVGGRVVIQPNATCASLPLFGRIGSGLWYCWIWLEDARGNRSWANRVQDFFYYDITPPTAPGVVGRTVPAFSWFGANTPFSLTIGIPVDPSRNSRDAVKVFWKFQAPPTSASDFDGSQQFNAPTNENELFTVPFTSKDYCGDDSLYIWLADSVGNVDESNYTAVRYRFDICPPTIRRILPDLQNIANLGQAFLDTVEIRDEQGVDTTWVRYRFGGAESEEPPRQLTRIAGTDNFALDIPDAGVTRRGVEYQVVALDSLKNRGEGPTSETQCESDSIWFPVRTRVEGEGDFRIDTDGRPVPLISGEDESNYQLFSVPYDLDSSSVMQVLDDDLGPVDIKQWRLFDYKTDNPEGSRFLEGTNARAFQPGRSYFIITRQENIVVDSGPGQTRRTVCNDTIQVYDGWNLIATPFNFPVDKESLSLINSNSSVTLRSFEGGWNITDVMEPWKGYALFVTRPSDQSSQDKMYLIVRPKAAPGRASKTAGDPLAFEPGDWAVKISGHVDNVHDLENWAGALKEAASGFDDFELAEPPVIGKFLKIAFLHPEWNLAASEFSTDFRPASDSQQVWSFEVTTNASRSDVNLSFDFVGDFPDGVEVHLIDEVMHSAHNLRANPTYSLKSGQQGVSRRFKLIVGSHDYAATQAGDIDLVPEQFALLQNFPNPFNPETSIRYNLPKATSVSILIYDLLGRKVRTLIDNEQKGAGYFTTRWNGLDDSGRQVASGVYFYRLKTSSQTISRKMILMK
ncbi:MAG: choice-of-anchor D domain-containing protein [bacterium]